MLNAKSKINLLLRKAEELKMSEYVSKAENLMKNKMIQQLKK